jgi:hypothetical protein
MTQMGSADQPGMEWSPVLCRETAGRAPAASLPSPGTENARTDRGAVLICALCSTPITSTAERIEVDGGHEHFEVNPHGAAFRFGCFASAVNVVLAGPPQQAWTWFPGHAWQVAFCAGCGEHLGWRFQSETRGFHGLLLDTLVEAEQGQE